jgi:glutathione S-transferase
MEGQVAQSAAAATSGEPPFNKDFPRMERPLIIAGAPGSPYTRKVISAARYCHVPYRFLSELSVTDKLPQPRVKLWPTCYFPDTEELVPETDSTPLLRKLQTFAPDRKFVPTDPRLALIDALIEDYADEWMTKTIFHYRWTHRTDIAKSTRILPLWFEFPLSDDALREAGEAFAQRQIGRLGLVGCNPITAPTLEESYERLVVCLARCFTDSPFMFGTRPSPADFGLYGQLSQAAMFDPSTRAIVDELAPRVTAWTIAMEDLTGVEGGDWMAFDDLPAPIHDLLREIGDTYAVFLLANEAAIDAGEEFVRTTISGRAWEQPAFRYQKKCLAVLRRLYAALSVADRAAVNGLLRGTGCMKLFNDSVAV